MDDNKNKVLRLRDVVLYTVSAMLFMDQIALASSLGPSSLFWWLYVSAPAVPADGHDDLRAGHRLPRQRRRLPLGA